MATETLDRLDGWTLEHPGQDVRGWDVVDANNQTIGTVADMIVDTDEERVVSLVLDTGKEISTDGIEVGDDVVYVRGSKPAGMSRVAPGDEDMNVPDYAAHEAEFRRHCADTLGADYATYEPAYRWGYRHGSDDRYRGRSYTDVAPELRTGYESTYGAGAYTGAEEAIRYAYDRCRTRQGEPGSAAR